MPDIKYIPILKKSWSLAWQKKYMWFFGFLASLEIMAVFSQVEEYLPADYEKRVALMKEIIGRMQAYISEKPFAAGLIMLGCLLVVTAFWAARTWGRSALIFTTELEERGVLANLSAGTISVRKNFWRVLVIGFLANAFLVGLAVVLFIPAITVMSYVGGALGILVVLAAVCIFIPVAITANFAKIYGLIYTVVSGLEIMESIERAYKIFRKNMAKSLTLFFLLILVSLGMSLVFNFIIYFMNPSYMLVGKLLAGAGGRSGTILVVGIKYAINTAILFFMLAVFAVFQQIAWISFFRQIAGQKIPEAEKEQAVAAKEMPEPEGANLDILEK